MFFVCIRAYRSVFQKKLQKMALVVGVASFFSASPFVAVGAEFSLASHSSAEGGSSSLDASHYGLGHSVTGPFFSNKPARSESSKESNIDFESVLRAGRVDSQYKPTQHYAYEDLKKGNALASVEDLQEMDSISEELFNSFDRAERNKFHELRDSLRREKPYSERPSIRYPLSYYEYGLHPHLN